MPAAKAIKGIGRRTINAVWHIGMATRFFMLILTHSGSGFRRFHLIIKELFSTGVMSLIIIVVAGLFVGMVLGLQGYETLKRYGSESALGSMVALSLVRELGPVVAALLFAGRAVQRGGRVRRLPRRRGADRGGRRIVLVADAGRSGFSRRYPERRDQEFRLWHRGDGDCTVRGLRCATHGGRRIRRDDAHGGDFFTGDSDAGFRFDRNHV